jgi:hypothetical protein
MWLRIGSIGRLLWALSRRIGYDSLGIFNRVLEQ